MISESYTYIWLSTLLGVISTLWAKTLAAVEAGPADWYCLIFESVTKNGGRIEH
jgi:hypothetical protein